VSNRGSKPVYIVCPIGEDGGSDIVPLYRFIDDLLTTFLIYFKGGKL
jgi:hypothetical protein